ncbi:GIY-YIG nuclease family protein [Methylomicrobium sp. Wu6]|uniref:GIY-YIG nuclease family protein n=1 Tax=Methylomicrobium sp. Wu6 TaxID=3107928 RepID=UPI002DD64441|nr:GIY-YIG nuclease family protein [Methylomicrobium sp. Wu6]MEC4747061.1 GIY-YIG nuclease family protein [Methylomicrobium sp. Wu6]
MIYFLQGKITRRIKIGFTTRFIHKRIGALQIGSPDTLVFLGAHPGDKRTEYELHNKFRETYSHGEWFNESLELTQYIEQYCIQDMEVAHSVDSLVSDGVATYENLLGLDYKEINESYMSDLANKLG